MEPSSCPEGGQGNQWAQINTHWKRPREPRSYHQHSLEDSNGANRLSWQHALEEANGAWGMSCQHTLGDAKRAKELSWQQAL